MQKVEGILQEVLKRVTPSEREFQNELQKAQELREKILASEGKHVEVMLGGSLARNTHLRNDRDIDLFVLFPKELSRKEFEKEGLRIGKAVFKGFKWETVFSEHPYVKGVIDGFEVEIVPSFKVESAELKKSSVDRSQFHVQFLKGKLNERLCSEVRLLKQFLKGIECYGADLKTSSFSGYVSELLILKYNGFLECLKQASNWIQGQVIDLENYYLESEAREKFKNSALIVVDPTDKNRNVSAALSINQFSRFIAASREFLKKPSMQFFFPKKAKPLSILKLKNFVEKEGLIAVQLHFPKNALSDVLWGQLKRLEKKIVSELERQEFCILRSTHWTDEKKLIILVFDLKANELEKTMVRKGPFVIQKKHSEKFLEIHSKPLSGPRIEEGRWVVEVERKNFKATDFLKKLLEKEKKLAKSFLKKSLQKQVRILSEKQVISLFKKDKQFQQFFTVFLKGKESFFMKVL